MYGMMIWIMAHLNGKLSPSVWKNMAYHGNVTRTKWPLILVLMARRIPGYQISRIIRWSFLRSTIFICIRKHIEALEKRIDTAAGKD